MTWQERIIEAAFGAMLAGLVLATLVRSYLRRRWAEGEAGEALPPPQRGPSATAPVAWGRPDEYGEAT